MSSEKLKYLGREHIERELWLRGDLSYLLLPDGQTRANAAINSWFRSNPGRHGPYTVVTHRGAGKSFLLVVRAISRCLQYPGQNARYGAPHYKQAVEITSESMPKILAHCPDDIKWQRSENFLRIWNPRWGTGAPPSTLWIFGSNRDTIQAQRGLRANWIGVDEIRDWDDPEYALNEVLLFQTVRQANPEFLIASTPPDSAGHFFWTGLIPQSVGRKSHFILTADDNKDFTPEERERLLQSCGGEDTVAWKREALCQNITDESKAVCPEFAKVKENIVVKSEKPGYAFHFIGADFGFHDMTAILFAFWDFIRSKLIIEHEEVGTNWGTAETARRIKDFSATWLREQPHAASTRRWADATPQELYDLEHDHSLFFNAVEKYDKWAALAAMRSAIATERIIIDPSCKVLQFQLENGIFNKTRKDFDRNIIDTARSEPQLAHLDAVAALVYLWRMCRDYAKINPYPAGKAPKGYYVADPRHTATGRVALPRIATSKPLVVTSHPI